VDAPTDPASPSEPPGFRHLCRRRRCCPEVLVDPRADAVWAAILVERGGGERPPGEVKLRRAELFELVHALDQAGLIDAARAERSVAAARAEPSVEAARAEPARDADRAGVGGAAGEAKR
jgi:hypothetical protein